MSDLKPKLSTRVPLPFRFAKELGEEILAASKEEYNVFQQFKEHSPRQPKRQLSDSEKSPFSSRKKSKDSVLVSVGKAKSNSNIEKPGTKRKVTQNKVQSGLSATEVAKELLLEDQKVNRGWEWLHLVAFSIKANYVGCLSDESKDLIKKTKQVQQIKENLVLGTAGCNTLMLVFESALKRIVKAYKEDAIKCDLWVSTRTDDYTITIKGKKCKIKVASEIQFDFIFYNKEKKICTRPFVVRFRPQSKQRPTREQCENFMESLYDQVNEDLGITRKEVPNGINTKPLVSLKINKK